MKRSFRKYVEALDHARAAGQFAAPQTRHRLPEQFNEFVDTLPGRLAAVLRRAVDEYNAREERGGRRADPTSYLQYGATPQHVEQAFREALTRTGAADAITDTAYRITHGSRADAGV